MNFLPIQYRIAGYLLALFLVGALIASFGVQRYRAGDREGRAAVQAKWDAERAVQAEAAVAAAREAQEETQRRILADEQAQKAHDQEVARAKADAATARAAARSLRDQLDAFVAAASGGAPGDPSASVNGPSAGSPVVVLADVFWSASSRAGDLAEALDAARAAGLQCQRSYQALTH